MLESGSTPNAGDERLSESTLRMRDAAMKGRAGAEKLQASIRAVSDRMIERRKLHHGQRTV